MKKEESDQRISSWHTRQTTNTPSSQPRPYNTTLIPFHSIQFIRYGQTYIDNYRKKKWGDDVSTNVSNRFALLNIIFDCLLRILIRPRMKTSPHSFKILYDTHEIKNQWSWNDHNNRNWKQHQHPIPPHSLACMYMLIDKEGERETEFIRYYSMHEIRFPFHGVWMTVIWIVCRHTHKHWNQWKRKQQ